MSDLDGDACFPDAAAAGKRQQAVAEDQPGNFVNLGALDKRRQRRREHGWLLARAASSLRCGFLELSPLVARKTERIAESRHRFAIRASPGTLLQRRDGAGT